MDYKNLVVYDKDTGYMNRLSLLLAKRKELRVNVSVFSDGSEVEKYAESQGIDLLLQGEDIPTRVKARSVYFFTESREKEKTEEHYVYKFQSVDGIIARIAGKKKTRKPANITSQPKTGNTRMIGIYSPIHRCGKTTYALSLGRELGKKYQVLYLNLEGYAGIGALFESGGDNLADLIYYAKQEQANMGMRIGMMAKKMESLDYIAPMAMGEELKTITKEEWLTLLQDICQQSVYEVIVLDLGDGVQGCMDILEECRVIHMPVLSDDLSQSKIIQFEENMKLLHKEWMLDRIHQIFLPEWVEDRWQVMMNGFARRMIEKGEVL